MKISSNTLAVLEKFSKINNGIYIEAGNVIKVCPAVGGSPTAKVVVPETFPVGFGFVETNQFLQIVKLFKDPDFDFGEKEVVISTDTRESTIRYSAPGAIMHPHYGKDLKLPTEDVVLDIGLSVIQDVLRSGRLLKMPQIAFKGDGRQVTVRCYNKDVPPSQRDIQSSFSVVIGETDKVFTSVYDLNVFSHIDSDFNMVISFSGIAHLKFSGIDFWVAAENVR